MKKKRVSKCGARLNGGGYQPKKRGRKPSNPPQGGSGVPSKIDRVSFSADLLEVTHEIEEDLLEVTHGKTEQKSC